MKREKVLKTKRELVKTCKVYNISLEGGDTFFANGILNHNTPPHIIRPVAKKALHWKDGGNDVFAKIVHHPGTTPQPFIRVAIERDLPEILANNFRTHVMRQ